MHSYTHTETHMEEHRERSLYDKSFIKIVNKSTRYLTRSQLSKDYKALKYKSSTNGSVRSESQNPFPTKVLEMKCLGYLISNASPTLAILNK